MNTYLVVDIDTVQVVLLDPCGHGVGCANGVSAGRSRGVGGAEGGYDKLNTRRCILGLDARPLAGAEANPFLGLVPRSFNQKEGERENVEALSMNED